MKNLFTKAFFATALTGAVATFAATLPKAADLVPKMGMGINIGNTMEVPNNPTAWGNPFPTRAYIDSLKAAGFNTIRIPCAWDSHASNSTINSSWMDSVKTVVDMVLSTGAYAILNIHWDGGWFESNISGSYSSSIDNKLAAYWKQIANFFKNYNERLIFAGANEPGLENNSWDNASISTLNRYYDTFIKTVRATGGNNATRTLIVQAPGADIEKSHTYYAGKMPSDPSGAGYLMFEPHFYPYNWALMEQDADWGTAYYYWGPENYQSDDKTHNTGWNVYSNDYYHWCDSVFIDSVFNFMYNDFVKKGYPVVIGEFASIKRISTLQSNPKRLEAHYKSRGRYYGYVAKAAKARGMIPVAWDTGDEGDKNMTIVKRQISKFGGTDGAVIDTYVLNGMRNAYGLGNYVNAGITHVNDFITGGNESASSSSTVIPPSSSSAIVPASSSSEEGTTALHAVAATPMKLSREGNVLRANASIHLFDLNGNLVRNVTGTGRCEMSLEGLRQGVYHARSGSSTLRVQVR